MKMIFFPLSQYVIFQPPSWPFCLNSSLYCNYFTLLLPLFSFSFLFLPFSFSFLPFSITFSPFFSSPFSYFFPQMTSADIFPPPPPQGGSIFQYIGPWDTLSRLLCLSKYCCGSEMISFRFGSGWRKLWDSEPEHCSWHFFPFRTRVIRIVINHTDVFISVICKRYVHFCLHEVIIFFGNNSGSGLAKILDPTGSGSTVTDNRSIYFYIFMFERI